MAIPMEDKVAVVVVVAQVVVEGVETSTLVLTVQNNGVSYPLRTRNEYGKGDKG